MKNHARFILFSVVFGLPAFCDSAFAVLQSGKNPDEEGLKNSSVLVSTVDQLATDTPAAPDTQLPKTTIRMKFKPRPQQLQQSQPPVQLAPENNSKNEAVRGPNIFLDRNPHAVQPKGTSPAIKTVGVKAAGYKKNPVLNHGRPKNTTTKSTFTVRQRGDQ